MTYPFDILKHVDEKKSDFDISVLDQRPFVQRSTRAQEKGTRNEREAALYEPGPQLWAAINTAIVTGQPLLLTGEPGTGKTQAAWYIARTLGLGQVLEFPVKSTTTARDLAYVFESVRFMADSMRNQNEPPQESAKPAELDRRNYIIKQPLWKAFESPTIRVLLIDEIDKAPRDFPNDLLNELDQWEIQIEELPGEKITVPDNRRPIVVITSNGERQLPDAFLRRCVYCDIQLTETMVDNALRRRREHGELNLPPEVVEAARDQLFKWRGLAGFGRASSMA
jgi:MoxR-like ATPase